MILLYIMVAMLIAAIVCLFIGRARDGKWRDSREETYATTGVIILTILGVAAFIFISMHYQSKKEVKEFISVRETLERSRTDRGEDWIERAAMITIIAEKNAWLAKEKWFNSGFWEITVPDEVENLEPLK